MAQSHIDKKNAEVWSELDQRFRAPLNSYFWRRVRDRSDAEDLTQEVFARLTRHPDQNNGLSIDAYVFKIASTVLTDWHRNRSSRKADQHRDLVEVSADYAAAPVSLVE